MLLGDVRRTAPIGKSADQPCRSFVEPGSIDHLIRQPFIDAAANYLGEGNTLLPRLGPELSCLLLG